MLLPGTRCRFVVNPDASAPVDRQCGATAVDRDPDSGEPRCHDHAPPVAAQVQVEQGHEALVVYRVDKQPRFVPACMCGWRSADAFDSAFEANASARTHVDLSLALAGRRS